MSMTLTQLLAIAGGIVLAGVVAHGAWAARKAGPKRAAPPQEEPHFGAAPGEPQAIAQPAAEVMQLRKQIRAGALEGVAPDKMRVRLLLPDGSEYGQGGTLSFADLAVDPGTDNVTMRALFANPDRTLLPGMYVRVRLEQAVNRDTYLVPRDALLRNAGGAHLLVAGDDGELRSVPVTAQRLLGPNWVVTEGLQGGERVVVENAAQLAPGQKIKPVERAAPSAPAATGEKQAKR